MFHVRSLYHVCLLHDLPIHPSLHKHIPSVHLPLKHSPQPLTFAATGTFFSRTLTSFFVVFLTSLTPLAASSVSLFSNATSSSTLLAAKPRSSAASLFSIIATSVGLRAFSAASFSAFNFAI